MSTFEYLLIFAAIILGLAVSDLAISLHRLLGGGGKVKWDLLSPLAAVVAFLKIITQWWIWRGTEAMAKGFTFEMFLGLLTSTLLLFLLAASALPDEPGDLRQHYQAVRQRWWTLFLGHWMLGNAVSIWAQMRIEGAHLSLLSPAYLLPFVMISLIIIRSRLWHGICLVGFAGLYLTQFAGQTLG